MSNQSSFTSAPKRAGSQKSNLLALPIITIAILIYTVIIFSIPCLAVNGTTFRSYRGEKIGVVLAVPGDETSQTPPPSTGSTMYPTISFNNGKFLWTYGDTFEEGSYECKSGKLIAYSYNGSPTAVEYIPRTGVLLWKGEIYQNTKLLIALIIEVLLIIAVGISITLLVREARLPIEH